MKIAMIGTRGVPAHYGGFETAIEEVGSRLAAQGHDILVFCRPVDGEPTPATYRGMRLVWLPSLRRRSLETLSHTALSVLRPELAGVDAALVFNAANAPFLSLIRMRGVPVATHVDGLEWRRSKWGGAGKKYYRLMESLAVRGSSAIIADAPGIADYYAAEFGAESRLIAYGAPDIAEVGSSRLREIGLEAKGYHLVVARFEPENHVLEIIRGYVSSPAELPLVVVGSAPYSNEYSSSVRDAADDRVRLMGGVWDQELLDQLYANAVTYLHGHSVGGTNPSLLRAAGGGTPTIAFDCVFNRGVIGDSGWYFSDSRQVAECLLDAEADTAKRERFGCGLKAKAAEYDWDQVADAYLELCRDLADGYRMPKVSGKRSRPGWIDRASVVDSKPGSAVVAHPSPDLYGSDRVLLETLSALIGSDRRTVLTLPESGPLVAAASERGVGVDVCPAPILRKTAMRPVGLIKLIAAASRAWAPGMALLRESKAEILLVNTLTIPMWLLQGRASGTRVVCHVHEAESSQPRWVRRLLYAPLLLADQLLVNSQFSLDVLAESWPQLRRRATVVYNGVPGPEEGATPPREDLYGAPRVLFVGRLSPRKGPQVAVEAMAILRSRGLDARLGLLGSVFPGYEWFEEQLHSRVKELGLDDEVEFHGFDPEIWAHLADADIVCVPSTVDEPFGNTAVEAMLAQRPLVVSRTSGLKEAAAGYESVRFVTPEDPVSIADAIQDLVENWAAVRAQTSDDRQRAIARHEPGTYQRVMLEALGVAPPGGVAS